MKRSTTVILILLGSSAVGLAAWKPGEETYPSVEACVAAGKHTEADCNVAFAAAQREHEATARHFTSRADCVAVYGPDGCEERAYAGGSFFMPMMFGYVLGRSASYHPLYRYPRQDGCGLQSSTGRCYSGYGGGSSGGFGHFGSWGSGGRTATGSAEAASPTVARGGFGGIGHGMSGGE